MLLQSRKSKPLVAMVLILTYQRVLENLSDKGLLFVWLLQNLFSSQVNTNTTEHLKKNTKHVCSQFWAFGTSRVQLFFFPVVMVLFGFLSTLIYDTPLAP